MAHIVVNTKKSKGTINKNIYGQFAEHLGRCIYEGVFVKEEDGIPNVNGMRCDVVNALKNIKVPVIRWPGGCFADTYHWMDGIGPAEKRKKIVNTNWGGVTEDNSFGTHEFLELCKQVGADPYICGNVGSGTVQEMSDWVEYCNMGGVSPMAELRRQNGHDEPWNVKYWGIGNENWGCGGNMTPEFYADECKRYSTFVRNYDNDHPVYKIACGANGDDINWAKVVAEKAGQFVDALSLHYYTVPGTGWFNKNSATQFSKTDYFETVKKTLKLGEIMDENIAGLKRASKDDHQLKLIVDEWGNWFEVEPGTNPGFLYQQNTIRDAVIAGLNLNMFNDRCDTVVMANIAQMINVLQAMILTDGPKMILTPTYHVYDLFKDHMDARHVESYAETEDLKDGDYEIPSLSVSSSEKDGKVCITVVNTDPDKDTEIDIIVGGVKVSSAVARTVAGDITAHNTFDAPETVKITEIPAEVTNGGSGIKVKLPASSVTSVVVVEA
ncbi:MAG: alpha-N-arabinofuranosidase [Lachnospiraceae bacterium]|nr:alpha-N-arabinofuranosidase [Lachnospiraceae bacterium]